MTSPQVFAGSAERLVVLAPDITRNLIALGAEANIVGIIENSDLQARLPNAEIVGDYQLLNIEAILALEPDLVVAWQGGNPEPQLQRLETLGLSLVRIKSEKLTDLPEQWRRLGELLDRQLRAEELIAEFNTTLQQLSAKDRRPVRTFYELWHQPLMSVNGQGWLGEILTLCGAQNILHNAVAAYPQVSVEAVLAAETELILASNELPEDWRAAWRNWPQIPAVTQDQLYTVEADYLHQLTLETLIGVSQVCSAVERAR